MNDDSAKGRLLTLYHAKVFLGLILVFVCIAMGGQASLTAFGIRQDAERMDAIDVKLAKLLSLLGAIDKRLAETTPPAPAATLPVPVDDDGICRGPHCLTHEPELALLLRQARARNAMRDRQRQ